MGKTYRFRPAHGGGMGRVLLHPGTEGELKELHPLLKGINHPDPEVRRIIKLRKLGAMQRANDTERAVAGRDDCVYVLMDLDRNVIKKKVMGSAEAKARNREIKSLGFAWCRGSFES